MPAGRDRDQRELAVLLKRGPPVLLQGHAKPRCEQDYRRAYQIATTLGDDHVLFKAIWGLWFCASMQRRTATARDHAEELVALAQRSKDEALFLEAIHCRWATAFFRGDIARSLTDSRERIKHYDPDRHSQFAAEWRTRSGGLRHLQPRTGAGALRAPCRGCNLCRTSDSARAEAQSSNIIAFAYMNAMTTITSSATVTPFASSHRV